MDQRSLDERILDFALNNPKKIAGAVGIASLMTPLYAEGISYGFFGGMGPAYCAYLALSTAREKIMDKMYRLDLKKDAFVPRAKDFIFNNIKPITFFTGALAAASFYALASGKGSYVEDSSMPLLIGEHASRVIFPVSMLATQLSLSLLKNYDHVRESFAELKNSTKEKRDSLADKIKRDYNFVFEHPWIGGAAAGLWTLSLEYHGWRDLPEWNVVEQGAYTVVNASLGTIVTAMAGGVLHTNSLDYYKHLWMSKICKMTGRNEDAIAHLKETFNTPTSHALTIERKLAVADLFLKQGQEKEAIEGYRKAAALFSEPENRILSSPDILRKMLFRKNAHVENRFGIIAESMNEVVEYVPSGLSRRRFIFKRGLDHDSIEREYHVNLNLASLFLHENVPMKPVQSVSCFCAPDGKTYHVMLRNNSQSLEEILEPLMDGIDVGDNDSGMAFAGHVKHISNNIALMHSRVTKKLKRDGGGFLLADYYGENPVLIPRRDYKEEFIARVICGRLYDQHPRFGPAGYKIGSNRAVDDFIDAALGYFGKLQKQNDFFVHGDAAPRHFLSDETVLDFERAGVGNPFVDLAQFYHGANAIPTFFLQTYCERMKQEGIMFDDAEEQMNAASVHDALCAAGTAAGRIPRGLGNAIKRNKLCSNFKQEMTRTIGIMNELGLDDLKRHFIAAMHYSALKDSRYIDFDELMKKLVKSS